jgi:uncharacterized protein YyaL (SSP411 family)
VGLDDQPDTADVHLGMLARLNALKRNAHRGKLARAIAGSVRRPALKSTGEGLLAERLEATYRWICQAQDAGEDDGVSGVFDLWAGRWSESYPETTGYIIPTLLALAEARGEEEPRERALRMADWSCEVQMQDGAVLSGLVGMRRGPAVFNTGQVVFGWLSAFQHTGEERYALSAKRACQWLIANQDDDGAWRQNLSAVTSAPVLAYNVRCAWALIHASEMLGEPLFAAAARQAAEWTLEQQNDFGWFANNAFAPGEVPLLHTISYVIEGLLGMHAFTREPRYLEAARRSVTPVVRRYEEGCLSGRLDERWQPTVRWRCPTGEAQIAVVLHRLARELPDGGYRETARRLIDDVAAVQLSLAGATARRAGSGPAVGGLPGSFPLWGGYVPFGLPNWAAKFFLDALLIETLGVEEPEAPTPTADA